jgi:polyphosphate kinase
MPKTRPRDGDGAVARPVSTAAPGATPQDTAASPADAPEIPLGSPQAYLNRELSWLEFAGRVLCLADDLEVPLLERVKFLGIMGMLHDEFFMKRVGGLKRQIKQGVRKLSPDGRTPAEELAACQEMVQRQAAAMSAEVGDVIRPALAAAGIPLLDYSALDPRQADEANRHFVEQVQPILTPLAVDAEHPFPFISNLGLNLAVELGQGKRRRFVRIKVPANRARWVPLSGGVFVALEQVIAANLAELFPKEKPASVSFFRVTRGAEGESALPAATEESPVGQAPGSIISQVTEELKARRFAGVVRLQVSHDMPEELQRWLQQQLGADPVDVYVTDGLLGLADFLEFDVAGREDLHDPPQVRTTHPRLAALRDEDPEALFAEIRRGDLLLHHPYQSFETSVLRFLRTAANDPQVLAIKVTIYRTSSDSPIVRALAEAARRGKQVAVLVEITARFDEAPNIAWGRLLENEGVHVSYGIEKLKTHVKLALVVREEADGLRRYVHVGTGNYHTGTARVYEDLGLLSSEGELAAEVAAVFNELTSSTTHEKYRRLLVAPRFMRKRFIELIRREAEHASAGRPSAITAKMNQLQDPEIIRELYAAGRAGVAISLNVRGLCCLRAGVPGLSENIRVFSVVGRYLEHGRIYAFANGGAPEYFLGSADWMKRNLDNRVETIAPVNDQGLQSELRAILQTYEEDNASAWDLQPDGSYVRRHPAPGEERRAAQEIFGRSG